MYSLEYAYFAGFEYMSNSRLFQSALHDSALFAFVVVCIFGELTALMFAPIGNGKSDAASYAKVAKSLLKYTGSISISVCFKPMIMYTGTFCVVAYCIRDVSVL